MKLHLTHFWSFSLQLCTRVAQLWKKSWSRFFFFGQYWNHDHLTRLLIEFWKYVAIELKKSVKELNISTGKLISLHTFSFELFFPFRTQNNIIFFRLLLLSLSTKLKSRFIIWLFAQPYISPSDIVFTPHWRASLPPTSSSLSAPYFRLLPYCV